MAGPLIILYGFSILIVRMVNPADPEEEEEENAEDDGKEQTLTEMMGLEDSDKEKEDPKQEDSDKEKTDK